MCIMLQQHCSGHQTRTACNQLQMLDCMAYDATADELAHDQSMCSTRQVDSYRFILPAASAETVSSLALPEGQEEQVSLESIHLLEYCMHWNV